MKPSSSKEEKIQHQFDSLAKKILAGETMSYIRGIAKAFDKEILFSELGDEEINNLYTVDEFYSDCYHYDVYGYDICVKNDMLIESLNKLPQKKRDMILLSFFLDMSDREISELLRVVRTTVFRNKKDALKEMKQYMDKGGNDNETSKNKK